MCYGYRDYRLEEEARRMRLEEEKARKARQQEEKTGKPEPREDKPLTKKVRELVGAR